MPRLRVGVGPVPASWDPIDFVLSRFTKEERPEIDVSLVCEDAEKLPFVDGHFDAATNLYLLHEVPRDVRARVLAEMFRVVRPGGLVVVADSLQFHDAPELTRELRAFPERFHEPYYEEYARQDLGALVSAAGFAVRETALAFLTKIVVAEKLS